MSAIKKSSAEDAGERARGERCAARPEGGQPMALIALTHTPAEQRLYLALLGEAGERRSRAVRLGVRELMVLSGLQDYSAVRRARSGLERKLSIDCRRSVGPSGGPASTHYLVYRPEAVFERRRAAGIEPHPPAAESGGPEAAFNEALAQALAGRLLSRREYQVAAHSAEGRTNAEIGERLGISPETVKFHLRHASAKLGAGWQEGPPGARDRERAAAD